MAQQVMTENQLGAGGEPVEFGQCDGAIELPLPPEGVLAPDRRDLMDGPIGAGLQIEQESAGQEIGEPWVHGVIMRAGMAGAEGP